MPTEEMTAKTKIELTEEELKEKYVTKELYQATVKEYEKVVKAFNRLLKEYNELHIKALLSEEE